MLSAPAEHGVERLSLFPLPLSDFENYMLADDRPSHPMVFTLIAHLSGSLDRPPFIAAVTAALACHLLLNCRVKKFPGRGWCWVQNGEGVPHIDWSNCETDVAFQDQPISHIDLRRESGLRIFVCAALDRARVVLHIHHSCCDGVGALEFLGEMLAQYGAATVLPGAETPTIGTASITELSRRDVLPNTPSERSSTRCSLWQNLSDARRMLFRRPMLIQATRPLDKPAPALNEGSRGGSCMHTQVISKEVTRQLRSLAQTLFASVNDLCTMEMLRLIRDWNRAAGVKPRNQGIRVLIPVSLRNAEHDHMPAANLVSYTFVTRKFADCDDPLYLLHSIRHQTSQMLQRQGQFGFLKCLRFARRIPGLLSLLLRAKPCFSSVVLAYVGDVRRLFSGRLPQQHGKWVAGNVTVERIDGVAPLRPNTRAAMSIGLYAGEMIVNLRTDSGVLSRADAADFLTQFVTRLERIATTGSLTPEVASVRDEPVVSTLVRELREEAETLVDSN